MLRLIGLMLWLWLLLVGVCCLDELEYDAQVAPPTTEAPQSPLNLWRGFVGQLHQVIRSWRTTKAPRVQLRSTTPDADVDYDAQPELQYYGALNPIYLTQNF
ncbi:uncharacterized protein LOC6578454 [Drosophila mojavensis]|uniref:Uncharacterized protein n=1 Tax=Drosophila mojavensis TaxID=7230 RepID=B4KRN0_DROMO|nr:uncharacterized protein LOC6578454 [Drosophila mojavensis]EDW08300.1 uncharacterized protein Dmoj_GI19896 [Drosophila mojavensis]